MLEGKSRAVETAAFSGEDSRQVDGYTMGGAAHAEPLPARRYAGLSRTAIRRRLLACADAIAAILAGLTIVSLDGGGAGQLVWALTLLPAWIVVAKILGLYDADARGVRHLTVDEVPTLVLWALIGTTVVSLCLVVAPGGRPSASTAIVAGVVALASVVILRALTRRLWRALVPPTQIAVIGPVSGAASLSRKLELFPDVHAEIAAVVSPAQIPALVDDPRVLAGVDRLCYAPETLDDDQFLRVVRLARSASIELSVIPPGMRQFAGSVRVGHLAELPLLDYGPGGAARSSMLLKRVLDVALSLVALLLLLPLFAAIAVAIKLDSRGRVFFSQTRAGRAGEPFRMHKFRTMVADAEARLGEVVSLNELRDPMFKVRDDPRRTRVGAWLRRWSLDELPQLWNVLVGDMSLVGPRPEQVEIVERYAPEHRFRLSVKPGITGPMQVYGRGELTFAERLALEADYIDDLSVGRDLRILGMTLSVVVRGEGAY
jgi:exopolysaccharide biosynthesis polyprenyl glycosylphosphotransferase